MSDDAVIEQTQSELGADRIVVNGNTFSKIGRAKFSPEAAPDIAGVANVPDHKLDQSDIAEQPARMLWGADEYVLTSRSKARVTPPPARGTPPGPGATAGDIAALKQAVIVGDNDERFRSPNSATFPFSTAFVIFYPNNTTCTGVLIGPHTGASAAHCFFNKNTNQWITTTFLAPGADQQRPGVFPWGKWNSPGDYRVTIPGSHSYRGDGNDIAIVDFLNREPGVVGTSWLGTIVRTFEDELIGVPGQRSGYDVDKQSTNPLITQQWSSNVGGIWPACYDIYGVPMAYCKWIAHGFDTMAGGSGSGVYETTGPNAFRIVGIHTYGTSGFFENSNFATHWIATVHQFFHQYAINWP